MRHPPFKVGPAKGATNWSSKEGAERLAATIRAAWRAVGVEVETVIEPLQIGPTTHRESVFCVRLPGLVNGLPTR
jgi:hypothetical protein